MSTARTTGNRAENRMDADRDLPHLSPAQRTASASVPETAAAAASGAAIEPEPEPQPRPAPGSEPEPPTPTPDHRLRWPEALAITLALLLGGAVASGMFRPMLPWLG